MEADLATLAASHVIFEYFDHPSSTIVFSTRFVGELRVTRSGDWLTLNFPAWPTEAVDNPPAALFTALGITSIVIGLTLQNSVGQIISGLLMLFEQPFQIGDWLDTAAARGRVVEVNWRAVHLETGAGTQITPDGKVMMALDVNKDQPRYDQPVAGGNVPIDTKHVKTDVVVENGGTVVIGGILVTALYNPVERLDETRQPVRLIEGRHDHRHIDPVRTELHRNTLLRQK